MSDILPIDPNFAAVRKDGAVTLLTIWSAKVCTDESASVEQSGEEMPPLSGVSLVLEGKGDFFGVSFPPKDAYLIGKSLCACAKEALEREEEQRPPFPELEGE